MDATHELAAILRDARVGGAKAPPESALLRMRSRNVEKAKRNND
jgi:hypothetical protein